MTPEQLHRAVLTATAFGDDTRYRELRGRFGPYDARGEFEHLEGAAAACLAYRLGEARQRRRRTGLAESARAAQTAEAVATAAALADTAHTAAADLTDTAGTAEGFDRAELGRFMAELRAAGPEHWPGHGPPTNFLEVEGVIRGLRGEGHLMAEIGGDRIRAAFRFLIRYLTATVPEIRDDFDTVVDRARAHIMRGLIG